MNRQEELDELKNKMLQDDSLPLKKGATNLVFGVGNPETKILFIGEGPGYWEDQKAEPFVGNAGKLLDKALQSIKLPREEVYITNVVHHRPPENRDPEPSELTAYGKYLDGIIKIIDPKLIVTLGRFSMGKFLPNVKISAVHGRTFVVQFNGKDLTIIPMFHPAAALRAGAVMTMFKEDFSNLPEIIKATEKLKDEKTEKSEQLELV